MNLLDTYCCQGGASQGYEDAGFEVYGVDIDPQPRYPFWFHLCGSMFEIETYRHRLFETNFWIEQPGHPAHVARQAKMGRAVKPGEFMHVVGNFTGVDHARQIMRMPWANRDGLREAIPTVYSEWVGQQLVTHLMEMAA